MFAQALPNSARGRAELFAVCEGRLWAMATRQRAVHAQGADQTEAQRNTFGTLLEATLPHAIDVGLDAKQAKRWQASGWSEVAHLLSNAVYRRDERLARHSERKLTATLRSCAEALLDGQ